MTISRKLAAVSAAMASAMLLVCVALAQLGGLATQEWSTSGGDAQRSSWIRRDTLISKAATLQGSYSHTWRTWEAVLKMIAAGQIRMAPMISHQMTIEHWNEAFHLVEERKAVKIGRAHV